MKTPFSRNCIIAFSLLLILAGPACSQKQPVTDDISVQIESIENGLLTYRVVPGEPARSLEKRMSYYHVPGVSVAVIDNREILWAKGWGETETGSGRAVNPGTLFQAASVSKPVTSAGALRLAEQGLLSLDSNVNSTLSSWQIPDNKFTETEKVTLRRLLSHSAGTNVHGFPGYTYDEPVPGLVELLDGSGPSNTEAVRVRAIPGSEWRYSGGGTSIVQLMMSDVIDLPFEEVMKNEVLNPAGMNHSTFSQPIPEEFRSRAATGHYFNGKPVNGKYHIYPEQAAAGLWTTPSDLARFAIDIQRSYSGKEGRVLSPEMAQTMLSVESGSWGLGFSLQNTEGDEFWFSHGGANEGFRSFFAMLGLSGKGVVIMTNGDLGDDLTMELMRAISAEYELPGFDPVVREVIEMEMDVLEKYTGNYYITGDESSSDWVMQIQLLDTVLLAHIPSIGWNKREIRPESENTFFFMENQGELKFLKNKEGEVIGAEVINLGPPVILNRK
jgi:CubicO group peptidase (beta-lactamase class C family)